MSTHCQALTKCLAVFILYGRFPIARKLTAFTISQGPSLVIFSELIGTFDHRHANPIRQRRSPGAGFFRSIHF